jgi:hypothetical protein
MRASIRKNRRALGGKMRFVPAHFGFRNRGSKSFLGSPKDGAEEFILETGRRDWKREVRIQTDKIPMWRKSGRMEISLLHSVGA